MKKQVISILIQISLVGSDEGARASFVWEETGVAGENARGRSGNDLTFPHTTPEIESGSLIYISRRKLSPR